MQVVGSAVSTQVNACTNMNLSLEKQPGHRADQDRQGVD